MVTFSDIPGLKVAAEHARDMLEDKCKDYTRRRDLMRQQVTQLSAELERRSTTLAREPQSAALDALETKLKNSEQTVFGLKDCESVQVVDLLCLFPRGSFFCRVMFFKIEIKMMIYYYRSKLEMP
jgi:hypothetical protein